MKALFAFIFLLIVLSCEKDEPQTEMPQNECWECIWYFHPEPKEILQSYCNRTDLGFKPAGKITQADIDLFIKQKTDWKYDLVCYQVK